MVPLNRTLAFPVLLSGAVFCGFAIPVLAEDDDLARAREIVVSANPDMCNLDMFSGDSDRQYSVSWMETDYDGAPVERHGKLYEVNCYAGAYNLVAAYVFASGAGKDKDMALVSFASPTYSVEYADGDTTNTRLKTDPAVSGFQADTLLINPVFDAETNTISTFEKWRGLGDAFSAGHWELNEGRFVLKYYAIDPVYEANLDNPAESLSDTIFVLYDAER